MNILTLDAFSEYLISKKLSSEQISAANKIVDAFCLFVGKNHEDFAHLTNDTFYKFASEMIEEETNSYENFVALLYYGYFLNHHVLIIAVMETLDGCEMFPNLDTQLQDQYGKDFSNRMFEGIEVPPLGSHPKSRPAVIKKVVHRIISALGPEESVKFFKPGLRDKYPASYVAPHKLFQETQDLDEFLKLKHQNFIDTLTKHYKENTLFFSQPITPAVLEFAQNDQKISTGVREGDRIVMTKIPYMADLALNATDVRERNYYICHNPLIREALRDELHPIDPIFCNCSGGFMKNFWEAVFEMPVDVELLESAIQGQSLCKFAIHIPPVIMETMVKVDK